VGNFLTNFSRTLLHGLRFLMMLYQMDGYIVLNEMRKYDKLERIREEVVMAFSK
jgi:hypothetical protein